MVIKKIILIILLITITPIKANAGFWDAVGACFTDFCNCGDENKNREEYWNGIGNLYRTVDRNRVCAPWNKDGGRDNNTCLIKKDYPGVGIGYYENLCGEQTPESKYMNPKIRVRGQQCNFIACWTTDNTLSWDGQCVTLAAGYGVFPGLHRMCARVAIPANYKANFPQDPGYTVKQHLNFEGVTVQDDVILGYDNQPVDLNPPKLCLYKDPAFFSFEDGFDIMDLDPNKQSAHKTAELHPVIKVILFLVDMAVQLAQAPLQLIDALITMIAGDDKEGQTTFASVLKDIFGFISWLIEKLGEAIAEILRAIGQINRSVDDTSYGCVPIPLGPYPPPFCPTIALFQTAYTQKICRTEAGNVLESTKDEPCVFSTLVNNFVRNSVRITFENFVPLCKPGETPTTSKDKCVVIEHLDAFPSARLLHLATGNTDIIPLCAGVTTTPCVNTAIPVPDRCIGDVCSKVGFRVVYGLKIGETSSPQSYYIRESDLPSCPSSSGECQEIWGVNASSFVDVSLTFPAIQPVPDISPLYQMVSLTDDAGKVSNFKASIVRKSVYDANFDFAQNPKQICVTKGTEILVGCENRAPFIKPQVYSCPYGGINCTSSYYAPQFVARVASGGDSTIALVVPKSMYNTNLSADTSVVNLAGFVFSSFVTDTTSIKSPFSGAHSPNPGSVFGNYLNNIFPINTTNDVVNSNAIYLYGLEYINDRYFAGGTRACLENRDLEKCPKNTTNCVLTNLVNRDTVNCKDFMTKLDQYPTSVVRCTSSQVSSCSSVAGGTLAGIPPSVGISILRCPSGSYCYTSPINADLCQVTTLLSDRYIPTPSYGAVLDDGTNGYYHIDPIVQSTNNVVCTPINDVVNCTDFIAKLALYQNANMCTAEQATRCSYVVDTIPALISGNTGASIRLCDSGIYCYTSPTNVKLCQNSTCTGNSPSGYNFDESKYILRDKTSYEMGLCTVIPQPNCAAITNYTSQDDGYAIWPETQVGNMATGSCRIGDVPLAPLQRWCVPNPDATTNTSTQTFGFSRLYTKDPFGNKIYSNVRCKPYQITLLSNTDNFPANYPRSTTSNSSDYSGNITLGAYDYGGTTSTSGGTYSSVLTFNIPDVTSNINYFRITSMANDDFALVKVNNVAVYSSPSTSLNCDNGNIAIGNFNAMSNNNNGTATLTKTAGGTVTLGDTCTWNRSSNIDLKPYLVQGTNTIKIDLIIIGGGGLHYSIDYKMNNP
jgi:hypothetical protein